MLNGEQAKNNWTLFTAFKYNALCVIVIANEERSCNFLLLVLKVTQGRTGNRRQQLVENHLQTANSSKYGW